MAISIHPYLTGAPHRIRYLAELYDHILSHPDVLMCTGEEILDIYRAQSQRKPAMNGVPGLTPPRILLLGTGGTIAMASDAGGAIKPALQADELVRAVPALERIAALETVAYSNKPGATLTLRDLASLSDVIADGFDRGCQGAVVVQGTDTIEETAFALELLARSTLPVVVTGAMRGAQAPGADGPSNLLAAVTVAASPDAAGLGTLVVLGDGPMPRGTCRRPTPPCRRPSARPARDRWERSRKASSACSAGRRRCRPCASRPRDWTKPRSPCCASGWTTTGACCARCRNWAIRARSSKPWARATCRRGWRRTSANWRRECRSC